ncbi:MAG TPA: hypothetical protein VEO54_19975 [Thermoanaerobaculia bacterium]|nr:hypothetical protein [Thermoanaerobaculia bacterium]
MKKLLISLLLFSIALAAAPAAMAECLRCRPLLKKCVAATVDGWESCYWANDCIFAGEYCTVSQAAVQPLASEFQVASVERIDEPQPATNEPRVASLEPAPAAHP